MGTTRGRRAFSVAQRLTIGFVFRAAVDWAVRAHRAKSQEAGIRTHVTPRETNAAGSSTSQVRSSIDVPPDLVVGLLGSADENLRSLERILAADIHVRGNAVTLSGEPADVALAERVLSELVAIVAGGQPLTPEVVRHSVAMLVGTGNESPAEVLTLDILARRGKTIRPKTLNQKRYVDAIDVHTIVFGIGPAGTGKTYLAMAKAVKALQAKQVTRIILTRPAVEAGERLGFLPGTLSEKIDPYLRPLYDALHDMMDPELIPKLMASGVIEVAPLAYMRGRTLNDAFIILDEAQNTTAEQMKMFLTRLGFGSKVVVTGDVTQIDLPGGARSGLRAAVDILDGIDDIHVAELTSADVVRHRLVADIVDAYARSEQSALTMNRAARRTPSARSRR
jgi:phosphate starvation-inducible protein PhoH and related proteins